MSKITHIYRIENENGRGPYNCGIGMQWQEEPHEAENGRPCPYGDTKLRKVWRVLRTREQREFVFGFTSLKSLKSWFTDLELERLKKLNFEIVKIPVSQIEQVFEGNKQCIFQRKAS